MILWTALDSNISNWMEEKVHGGIHAGAGKDQAVLMALKHAFRNWDHVERTEAWGWDAALAPMCSGWHGVTCNPQVEL